MPTITTTTTQVPAPRAVDKPVSTPWLPTTMVDKRLAVSCIVINAFVPCFGSLISGIVLRHRKTFFLGIVLTLGFWVTLPVLVGLVFYHAGLIHGWWLLTNQGAKRYGQAPTLSLEDEFKFKRPRADSRMKDSEAPCFQQYQDQQAQNQTDLDQQISTVPTDCGTVAPMVARTNEEGPNRNDHSVQHNNDNTPPPPQSTSASTLHDVAIQTCVVVVDEDEHISRHHRDSDGDNDVVIDIPPPERETSSHEDNSHGGPPWHSDSDNAVGGRA